MNKLLYAILSLITLILFFVDLNPPTEANMSYEEIMEGTVESSTNEGSIQNLTLEITRGSLEGEEINIENDTTQGINPKGYDEGDRLVILRSEINPGENNYSVVDTVRRPVLFWLFILFIAVVALVSQKQGIKALLGMIFSFFVLFRLVLPLILLGYDPVWSAIGGCVLIIPATFYLSHGIKHKTSVAIVGTLITLILTGILAYIFAHLGNLSGLSDEAASFLKSDTGDRIDFQGLLLAGILISMLGVLDDISVSQASVVQELEGAKKNISFVELYRRTMNVGKDHIASMVNTLVLVYAGASIPLLLLFIDHSHTFWEVLNYEFVAKEIIQTLVGSIGLILTVPVTTFIACIWHRKSA